MLRTAFTTIIAFLVLFPSNGFSQCDGSLNNGNPNTLTTGAISTPLNVFDFSFSINTVSGEVTINSTAGLTFLQSAATAGEVANVSMGTDISALGPYVSGPLIVYNTMTHMGPFGGGASGFIAVLKDGKYGWIQLGTCGTRVCNPNTFEYSVMNRCLNGVSCPGVIAGDPATLTPGLGVIPTLSQWSMVILALMMLIVGVVAIKEEKTSLKS